MQVPVDKACMVISQPEEADDFYAAGRSLAEHITGYQGKDIPVATLQALIRDLLPQHDEAQEALRSIVGRPGFLQLTKLAGSGKGTAEKVAFTESLRKIYSAEIVWASEKLVNGILSRTQAGGGSLEVKEKDGKQTTKNGKDYNLVIFFGIFFMGVRFGEINAKADALPKYVALALVLSAAIIFKEFVLDEWVIPRHQYRSSNKTVAALIIAFGIVLLLPFVARNW